MKPKSENFGSYHGPRHAVCDGRAAVTSSCVTFQRLIRTTASTAQAKFSFNGLSFIGKLDSVMGHARNVSLHFDQMHMHLRNDGLGSVEASKCVGPMKHSAAAMLAEAAAIDKLEGVEPKFVGVELFRVMKAHAEAVNATAKALSALTDYYLTAQRISVPQS